MAHISIAEQFSQFPSGRFRKFAKYSGEAFREEFLRPALRSGQRVTVLLDGTRGFNPSFLEEAFGGLIRVEGFTKADLDERLEIQSADASYIFQVQDYIEKAEQARLASSTRN